jgi:hypothetical protein
MLFVILNCISDVDYRSSSTRDLTFLTAEDYVYSLVERDAVRQTTARLHSITFQKIVLSSSSAFLIVQRSSLVHNLEPIIDEKI